MIKLFTTDQFTLPLPAGHTFPSSKYRLLRERVERSGLVQLDQLLVPHPAEDAELCLAHDRDYVERATRGLLTEAEMKRIGFPWSPEMIWRARHVNGASIEAAFAAISDGISVNLAGGTHHAFRDHGEGYCVFNDTVIAARSLQREGCIRRVVIIDLDVHQGNGTAVICRDDPSIYTFSMHGAKNYPLQKERSDLDIALPDQAGDTVFLDHLARGLRQALEDGLPDFAIYLAGADPFAGDRLGRLALTKAGLAERDRLVFDVCQHAGLPLLIVMAGGYAVPIEDSVDIYWQTVLRAIQSVTRPQEFPERSREKS